MTETGATVVYSTSPDSQPLYRGQESGLVRAWQMKEPEQRPYVVAGLVPTGALTALYGGGGFGKSYLAVHLATHIALGREWLGRAVRKSPVLYVDAELDAGEFMRRAYRIARGIGQFTPAHGLHYYRLPGSLADPGVLTALDDVILEAKPGFIILDSLMTASAGRDLERSPDTIMTMKQLERWGSMLVVDHTAKPQPGVRLSDLHAFGSVFKKNLARSTFQVIQGPAGGLRVEHTKHNFGPRVEPFGIALDFDGDKVRVTRIDVGDERLAGLDEHIPAAERTLRALFSYPDGATPELLADDTGVRPKTIKNHLTELKQRRRAESAGGIWRAIPDGQSPGLLRDRDAG